MNETIELLLRHRSIRRFKPDPVEPDKVEAIVRSAQMASSSSHVQAYSIIGVSDPALRSELAELSGNAHVTECPLFLVWCADLKRLDAACAEHRRTVVHETAESFLIATVDAALAAQNAAVAAESLGLGICYIGGIRNRIAEVAELLGIPRLVYPVFGMCVGYPVQAQAPIARPRLPLTAVYHQNRYDDTRTPEELAAYDETYRTYMKERSGGKSDAAWTEQMAARMGKPDREHMRAFFTSFALKLTSDG
jgi:FMN reductase (NADPH)